MDAARPTTAKIFPYPPEFEKVTIESFDGTPVSAMVGIHRDGKVRPGLVITHGFMGSKHQHYIIENALTAYADWGFNVLALDYRFTTLIALRPFGPCSVSKLTESPSASDLNPNPLSWMAE